MKIIFRVFNRRLNVTSNVDKIIAKIIDDLLCFSERLTVLSNVDGAMLGYFFEEINFFIPFHVLFK